MPYSPQGITVEPNGQTVVVTITESGGGTPTVYTDRTAQTTVSMPSTITARKTFFLTDKTTFTVSCKVGGLENANGNGGTATVDLTGGGIGSVGVGVPTETQSLLSKTYAKGGGAALVITGPALVLANGAALPSGAEYVWNKTNGAGTLLDIITGVAA